MIARFAPALTAIDQLLRDALALVLEHNDFAGWLSAGQVKELLQVCDLDEDALRFSLLSLAAECAVTPLSHFNVGAIARGISGNLYFGANMESHAAPQRLRVIFPTRSACVISPFKACYSMRYTIISPP